MQEACFCTMTAALVVHENVRSTGLFMLLQAADFIESRDTDRKPGKFVRNVCCKKIIYCVSRIIIVF